MNLSKLGEDLKGFLRALRADLVDKRLLPVVAVLVAAAIGVPVAFSLTATKAPPVASTPAPIGATGPGAALTAAKPPQQPSAPPAGHLHDPFASSGGSKKAPTVAAPGSPITARTGATGPTGAGGTPNPTPTKTPGATGGSPGTPLKPQLTAVATRELRVYSVDYSFGQGASIKDYSSALRLDAVPSNAAPVAQFLGVTKDGRKGAFLIWGPATASGDGACIDGQTPCQVVELQPGQTEFIDVTVPNAGIVQFELDLNSITTRQAATRAEALKAHMRQSTDGVKILSQSNAQALAKFEYSTVYGTLLPRTNSAGSASRRSPASQTSGASGNASSQARPARGLGSHAVRGHGAV